MRFPPAESQRNRWMVALTIVVTAVVILVAWVCARAVWGKASLSYQLTPTGVEIRYGLERVVLPREAITDVRMVSPLTRARRHMGTAMPGLYEGRWSFAETGPLILYSTSRDFVVLIETRDGRWGISPADPEGFVAAYQADIPGHYPPVESGSAWAPAVLGAVSFLTVVLLAGLMIPLWRISRHMEYELGERALLIHGSLSPIVLPYSEITGARIDHPAGSPLKVFGASLPGLYWGSFSWRPAGGRIKLCATRLRPLVIVSTRKQTYGLSPQDPQRFVEELQRRTGNGAGAQET